MDNQILKTAEVFGINLCIKRKYMGLYNRTTWGNTLGHSVAHAWLQAGYKVENVNLEKNIVAFIKSRDGLY